MNAHKLKPSSGTDHKTTLHSCGCPNYEKTGGGYIFYNFLTGESLVGCRHMHELYIAQAKKFMNDYEFYKSHATDLEMRLKRVVQQRIQAEDKVADLEWEIKRLKRKLDELTGKVQEPVEDPFACFE